MMADLDMKGPLNLMGNLTLKSSGGKVTIGGVEVLVEVATANAPPVILPPPPAAPSAPGPDVAIINNFNKTVMVGNVPAVALGIVIQANMWPGLMLPSTANTSPVTASGFPMNVKDDMAIIFPSGGSASFSPSGQ